MKNRFLLIILLSSFTSFSLSQTCSEWKWAEKIKKNYDLNYGNWSDEIAFDTESNLIIGGTFSTDSIIFNNGIYLVDSVSSYYNGFIAKYDSSGNTLWAVNIPTDHQILISDIQTDDNNNIYLNGHFRADTLFLGTDTLLNQGIYNHFVSKMDPNGNFIWSRSFGGLSGWGDSRSLAVKNNIVYTSGNMFQNGGFNIDTVSLPGNFYNKSFIARFDTAGNFIDLFTTETSGGHDRLRGMSVDDNGNMFITGHYTNDLIIDTANFPVLSGTTVRIFLAKLNSNFEVQYTHYSESAGNDYSQTVLSDAEGNCYIGGVSLSDTLIMAGDTAFNYNDFFRLFIGKFDPNGNPEWLFRAGGSSTGNSDEKMIRFAWNEDQNLMTFMNFDTDTVFFGQDTLHPQAGNSELWLLKLNPDDGGIIEEYELRELGNQSMGGIATGVGNAVGICGNHKGKYGLVIGNDTLVHVNEGNNASVSFVALYNSFGVSLNSSTNMICSNDSIILYGTENLANYQWFWNNTPITDANSSSLWVSQPGDYHLVGTHSSGCTDTSNVISISLTLPSSTIAVTACNSYTSPSGLYNYTTSGVYMDTIPSVAGCDSIITINLSIYNSNTGTETVTTCAPFTWTANGTTYTSSTTDIAVLTNLEGCDSTVTLNLTINTVNNGVTQAGTLLTADESGAIYQWLNCSTMTPISGGSNQSYTATANGDFAVIVTNNGCLDTSACYTVTSVGMIENTFRSDLLVYPNPINGNLSIDLGENNQAVSVTITDLNGNLILSNTYSSSKLLNLKIDEPAGVYLLVIQPVLSVDKKAIIRLIKE